MNCSEFIKDLGIFNDRDIEQDEDPTLATICGGLRGFNCSLNSNEFIAFYLKIDLINNETINLPNISMSIQNIKVNLADPHLNFQKEIIKQMIEAVNLVNETRKITYLQPPIEIRIPNA